MTQHPKGAELVAELIRAVLAPCLDMPAEYRRILVNQAGVERINAARNAIIALIDDPVRAAGPELLPAAKEVLSAADAYGGAAADSVRVRAADGALRAAIAKAEAPADAEGGER